MTASEFPFVLRKRECPEDLREFRGRELKVASALEEQLEESYRIDEERRKRYDKFDSYESDNSRKLRMSYEGMLRVLYETRRVADVRPAENARDLRKTRVA